MKENSEGRETTLTGLGGIGHSPKINPSIQFTYKSPTVNCHDPKSDLKSGVNSTATGTVIISVIITLRVA